MVVSNEVNNLKSQLERRMSEWFAGSQTELSVSPVSDKVGGFLIWNDFAGQSQRERQAALWARIKTLPYDEQLRISSIFTVTKDELDSIRENE